MARLNEIVEYCNGFLSINDFEDYCPNGLQVEGKAEIKKIIVGVTACQALLEQAILHNADAVLVHHGYFWKGESAEITGLKRRRIACLLNHDVSLLAYHLPLDAHNEVGNNVTLAQQLGIEITGCISQGPLKGLLWQGQFSEAMTAQQVAVLLEEKLNRTPLHLPSSSHKTIKTLAWCSGGAQAYIEQAAALGVDAYMSGEVSEQTFHLAKELDLHYFSAGHHATESFGVQALGQHLSEKFQLSVEFINIDNPV